MKLWYLRQNEETGRDYMRKLVVRAEDEKKARGLAIMAGMDENPGIWTDNSRSCCIELPTSGEAQVIIMTD